MDIKKIRDEFKKNNPNAGPYDINMPIMFRDIEDVPNFKDSKQVFKNIILKCIPSEKLSTVGKLFNWINNEVKFHIMEHFDTDNETTNLIIEKEFDNTLYRWILIHFTN